MKNNLLLQTMLQHIAMSLLLFAPVLHTVSSDNVKQEIFTVPFEPVRKLQDSFHMLERNKTPCPDKFCRIRRLSSADRRPVAFIGNHRRKISPTVFFLRESSDQTIVGCHIGSGTQQEIRLPAKFCKGTIFMKEPLRRNCLPLAILVNPLTDLKNRPVNVQPLRQKILNFRNPAGNQEVTGHHLPLCLLPVLAPFQNPAKLFGAILPAHLLPLFFHLLHLHKDKAVTKPFAHGLAERNLVVIDVVRYKGDRQRHSASSLIAYWQILR